MKIGVISDTHGLVRPEALDALQGADLVLHAGDVGAPDVLEQLGAIAPVVAVRGNVDTEPWAESLPGVARVDVEGWRILMVHDVVHLPRESERKGVAAVVFGHSHKPVVEYRGGQLFLNPGSAGPRRFQLPVAVALLEAQLGRPLVARIVELPIRR